MATIIVNNVNLDFPIYGTQRSLRRALFRRATGGFIHEDRAQHHHLVVTALNDINFQLSDGDRLGLIGHNGAGKSSLLKVLAGVYEPTRGQVLVDGQITSLFELAPGMDMEDTGYETMITAGMLLGMTRTEIERKIPEIERFSELGEYMSLPVRTYSAGMMTRLGFSLATALEPEILLLDEGIGASDARFAERAGARLQEFVQHSAILVLASHSDDLIRSVCNKAALLEAGRIVEIGPVEKILAQYHETKANNLESLSS
jgi:ABC-type polysaccharide/polyol phosphate transport system ATPase subunit